MNELISEVEGIIKIQKHLIERNKKFHEYPFMNDCDHFYRLVLLHKTLEVWEGCLRLLHKYRKKRCAPIGSLKGETIERYLKSKVDIQEASPKKNRLK